MPISLNKSIFKSNIFKHCLILFSSQGITAIIGAISSLIYGVIFSKTDIAIISIFEMFVQFVVSVGFNWSSVGVIRFGKTEIEEKGTLNQVTGIRLQIFTPPVLIILLGLFLFQDNVKQYIGISSNLTVLLLGVNILLLVFHDHITQLFTTLENHKANAFFFISVSLFKILILISFALHVLELDVVTYLALNILGLFILIIWRLSLIKKKYFWPLFKFYEQEEYIRFFKFVAPQFFGFVGVFLINWIDTIVIKEYCSLDDLGAYNYLYSIFVKFAMVALIINTVFFPRILSWKLNSDENKIGDYLKRVPIIVFISALSFSSLFCLIFPSLFDFIFDGKFEVAYASFQIILYALPLYYLSISLVPILNAYDKVIVVQLANIIAAVTNYAVDIYYVPKVGIIGGAYGTITAEIVKVIIIIAIVKLYFINKPKLFQSNKIC